MYAPAGRRGSFLLVAILLLISIGLEQCCIVRLIPWLSDLGAVQPMFVFLDIPVRTPVPIDWIPVGFIFIFFYSIVYLPRGSQRDAMMKRELRSKLWGLVNRWWLLLVCILIPGALYNKYSDYLPRQVRNGIDSFGIRADLILPYPSDERVHLQGSMIMLVFCIIGWRLLIKKAEMPVPEATARQETPQSRLTMRIPEPVEVKERAPKSPARRACMSVAAPQGLFVNKLDQTLPAVQQIESHKQQGTLVRMIVEMQNT